MTQANQQLELFPGNHSEKKVPTKRVSIISLKMVRESTILYPDRSILFTSVCSQILRHILEDADREHFLVICLDSIRPYCIIGFLTRRTFYSLKSPAKIKNAPEPLWFCAFCWDEI
jgi:hypothetical protein